MFGRGRCTFIGHDYKIHVIFSTWTYILFALFIRMGRHFTYPITALEFVFFSSFGCARYVFRAISSQVSAQAMNEPNWHWHIFGTGRTCGKRKEWVGTLSSFSTEQAFYESFLSNLSWKISRLSRLETCNFHSYRVDVYKWLILFECKSICQSNSRCH